MMKTITFTCETITPMFLSGADGSTPELRPPSIKGALRFWWRAMNGHLSLKELKERESEIFGGTDGESGGRSKVIIRAKPLEMQTEVAVLVPHKDFMKQKAFKTKQRFEVVLGLVPNSLFSFEQMKALFELVCVLGGFGKRSRRGMGSVRISKYIIGTEEANYVNPDLKQITDLLNNVNASKCFTFNENTQAIQSNFGAIKKYPYIVLIEKGNPNVDILLKISKTTNELHGQPNYGNELGKAIGGRFSSPIYVSVLETTNGKTPIITTLNAIPNDRTTVPMNDTTLQKQFKSKILK